MTQIKENQIKISVIVPVFNVEKYLTRCIKSLLQQSFRDFEVLLIDDGSTDKSGDICEDFARKYSRILCKHKENGGLGSARNYGLKYIRGKYVCFVDSDDWVTQDYLEFMYTSIVAYRTDICICGYIYNTPKYKTKIMPATNILSAENILIEIGKGNSLFNFAWNKLYRSEVIINNNLKFSNRHCAEDMLFNIQYYRMINSACLISEPLYFYWVNLLSLSNGKRNNFINDMKIIYDEYRESCKLLHIRENYADNLRIVLMRNSISNFYNSSHEKLKTYKKFFRHCGVEYDVNNLNPVKSDLVKTDYFVYNFMRKNKFICMHILIKVAKICKRYFFPVYCNIRNSVSGNKK